MGSPARPAFVKQLDGSRYAANNCNMAAAAMAVDRATLGTKRVSAATVRALTGDTSGGTNLGQARYALLKLGVDLDVEYGAPMSSFNARLRAGQGVVLQGQSSATRGTRYQGSETFGGNHSWFVSEARGWNSSGVPSEYLVYDPLADGRRSGIARSPFWLPRVYLLRFAERLDIGGGRRLGSGRVYAGFTRDTEPHVHLRYGGRKTRPWPDRTRAVRTTVNVRSSPRIVSGNVVDKLAKGDLFVAWQRTSEGDSYKGSRVWYGDHNGRLWVHSSRLRYKGGST